MEVQPPLTLSQAAASGGAEALARALSTAETAGFPPTILLARISSTIPAAAVMPSPEAGALLMTGFGRPLLGITGAGGRGTAGI